MVGNCHPAAQTWSCPDVTGRYRPIPIALEGIQTGRILSKQTQPYRPGG